MALAQYNAWTHDGKPFILCAPGQSLVATLTAHGYEVESYPDQSHLLAEVAEDHCPYSQTPWPGVQPYPHGMAIDIMPGGVLPLAELGARIFADTNAGVAGTEAIKYMNWTDAGGSCWHDKWQPNHVRTSSSDRGHIHISFRTDYVDKATSYDPAALIQTGGNTVTTDNDMQYLIWRVEAIFNNRPFAVSGPTVNATTKVGERNLLHDAIAAIGTASGLSEEQVADLSGKVAAAAKEGAAEAIDGAGLAHDQLVQAVFEGAQRAESE